MTTPIIILVLLTFPLGLAFLISKVIGVKLNVRKYSLWGLGAAFIFFSIGHFVKASEMVHMLPPWVPYRFFIIYATGLLELVVGIILFIPKFQNFAAKSAIVILVVFFPANIYAALNATGLGGHQWGAIYLLIRTPLQLILIGWAYVLCIEKLDAASSGDIEH
jgi:uncharacterized membrane protein